MREKRLAEQCVAHSHSEHRFEYAPATREVSVPDRFAHVLELTSL